MQPKLGLHDAPVAAAPPEHELVAAVSTVETANDAADDAGKVHVGHGGVVVEPRLVGPGILLHGEIEGQGNVLHAPLQTGVPDGGKGENTQGVPEPVQVLHEASPAQVAGWGDQPDALPVRLALGVSNRQTIAIALHVRRADAHRGLLANGCLFTLGVRTNRRNGTVDSGNLLRLGRLLVRLVVGHGSGQTDRDVAGALLLGPQVSIAIECGLLQAEIGQNQGTGRDYGTKVSDPAPADCLIVGNVTGDQGA